MEQGHKGNLTQGEYNLWFVYYQCEACDGMMAPWLDGGPREDIVRDGVFNRSPSMECCVCGMVRTEEEFQELVKAIYGTTKRTKSKKKV